MGSIAAMRRALYLLILASFAITLSSCDSEGEDDFLGRWALEANADTDPPKFGDSFLQITGEEIVFHIYISDPDSVGGDECFFRLRFEILSRDGNEWVIRTDVISPSDTQTIVLERDGGDLLIRDPEGDIVSRYERSSRTQFVPECGS